MRLKIKTSIAAVVVLSNVLGNFFLKRGMPAALPTPLAHVEALLRPSVSLGVLLLILWLLSRTRADLSFAVPATAIACVFETVLAKYILKERVSRLRWAGAMPVVCGVALVSS